MMTDLISNLMFFTLNSITCWKMGGLGGLGIEKVPDMSEDGGPRGPGDRKGP